MLQPSEWTPVQIQSFLGFYAPVEWIPFQWTPVQIQSLLGFCAPGKRIAFEFEYRSEGYWDPVLQSNGYNHKKSKYCFIYRAFKTSRWPAAAGVPPATLSLTVCYFSHDNKYIITCQQTSSKSYSKTASSHSISNNGSPCSNIQLSILFPAALISKTRQRLLLFMLEFARVSLFPFAPLNSAYRAWVVNGLKR